MCRNARRTSKYAWRLSAVLMFASVLGVWSQDIAQEYLLQRAGVYQQSQDTMQAEYRSYQPASKVYFPDNWNANIYSRDKGVVKELTQVADQGQRGGVSREPPRGEFAGHPPPPPFLGHRTAVHDDEAFLQSRPDDLQSSPQGSAYRASVPDDAPARGGHGHCGHGARPRDPGPPTTTPVPYRDRPRQYAPREVHSAESRGCHQHPGLAGGPVFPHQDRFPTAHFGAPVDEFYGGPLAFPGPGFHGGEFYGDLDNHQPGYLDLGDHRAPQLVQSPSSEVTLYTAPVYNASSSAEPSVEVLKTEVMALPASQIVFDIPPSNTTARAEQRDPLVASASDSSSVWTVLAALGSNATSTTPTTTTSTTSTTPSTTAPTVYVTPSPAEASRRSDTVARLRPPPPPHGTPPSTVLLMKLHGQPRGKVVVVVPDDGPPPPAATPRCCPCERPGRRRQRGAELVRPTLEDSVAMERVADEGGSLARLNPRETRRDCGLLLV